MSESTSEDESVGSSLGSRVSDILEQMGTYLRVTRAQRILRRYFAMNAFDGAMTSLGVVIGAYITSIADSGAVIGVILLSGVAMAVSGFSGRITPQETTSSVRRFDLGQGEKTPKTKD